MSAGWREVAPALLQNIMAELGIEPHPACLWFRRHTKDEQARLTDSIREQGVHNAVVLWRAAGVEQVYPWLLDGLGRLISMATLPNGEELIRLAFKRPIYNAAPTCDPWKYTEAVNDSRRHESAEDRRARIAARLRADPARSDRSVAKEIGTSPSTVGAVRKAEEEARQLSKLDTRVGDDGKTRMATPAKSVGSPYPNEPSPETGGKIVGIRQRSDAEIALQRLNAWMSGLDCQLDWVVRHPSMVNRVDHIVALRLSVKFAEAFGVAVEEMDRFVKIRASPTDGYGAGG